MEFTLRHPYPLEAFLALAAGHRGRRRGGATGACSPIRRSATRLKEEIGAARRAQPLQRQDLAPPDHRGGAAARASAACEGQTIGALAARAGRDPFDVFLDFGLDGELDAMFDCRLFNTDENEVRQLLRHPNAAVALSDAGAHLSFLCDAGFGLHLFGHWVRERGDLTLEEAVKRVTSDVAVGLSHPRARARSPPGAWADLILFDPATVGRGDKRRVNDLPTGATASTRRRWDCTACGSTASARWTSAASSPAAAGLAACCATSRGEGDSSRTAGRLLLRQRW